MRFSSSSLATTITLGLLAGCSGNMAATPSAATPNIASQSNVETSLSSLSKRGFLPQGIVKVALRTSNGVNYVTAVLPPVKEPNCGTGSVALHDDATNIFGWETFTLVYVGNDQYAFKTNDGKHYITAVKGGGIGGPNDEYGYSQLHTDAKTIGAEEIFFLVPVNPSKMQYALQTSDQKHFVTAANGGGCGESANKVPFHTDATSIGAWEKFTFVSP